MDEKRVPLTESVFYILLALRKPNHGYGIIQDTEQRTDGRVKLGAGTLYGALQTLVKKGWIRVLSRSDTSRKKTEYELLPAGKAAFDAEVERMELALRSAKAMEEEYAEVPTVVRQGQSVQLA